MIRTVSYVVAVHNEERVLESTVGRITARLKEFPGSEVLLVENGSTDSSAALVRRLAAALSDDQVGVKAAESERGFGHALRRGMELSTGDLVVLTAADLPFGFSDLDNALASFGDQEVVFGSKTHPESSYTTSPTRRVLSWCFHLLRNELLDLGVGDTQGTALLPGEWARLVAPRLQSGDYLVTTEIAVRAERDGLRIREVPVVADDTCRRPSSVRPLRDSMRMFHGLLRLRRHFASDAATAGAPILART